MRMPVTRFIAVVTNFMVGSFFTKEHPQEFGAAFPKLDAEVDFVYFGYKSNTQRSLRVKHAVPVFDHGQPGNLSGRTWAFLSENSDFHHSMLDLTAYE